VGAEIALFAAAFSVGLEGAAGGAPDGFIEIPINGNSRFVEERIYEGFGAAGCGD
jgi:hypothetical protein